MIYIKQIFVILLSYLLGCLCTGYYLTRLCTGKDIRDHSSKTAGARNVGRILGAKGFILTFSGDFLKGAVAVLLALALKVPDWAVIAAVVAVIVGHIYPLQLAFRGGKGVATYLGVTLGLSWVAALGFCAVWLAVAAIFRMSSLAGLTASALVPLWAFLAGQTQLVWPFLLMAAIIFFTHRENIARLLSGRESKIKLGK